MLESPALLRVFSLVHIEIMTRRAAALPLPLPLRPHCRRRRCCRPPSLAAARLETQDACWTAHIGPHSQLRPLLFIQHF